MTRTRINRAVLGAGAVLLAVIVGLVMMVRSEDSAQAGPPPPGDRGTTYVACASSAVRSGEVLGFTVRNPGRVPFEYGLALTVQRWDGSGWRAAYRAAPVLSGGTAADGRLVAPEEELLVPAMALDAPAGGAGPAQQLRLTGVPQGWYRLVVDRVGATPAGGVAAATGIVQVVA